MKSIWRHQHKRLVLTLQFLAFAALLFGGKLWVIHTYGNDTPFWDQWDAEAVGLYEPFLQGRLMWRDLIAAHNEHRILTTRLLGLLLLSLNGGWSPMLQMVVNAALHIAVLAVIIWLVAKSLVDDERSMSLSLVTLAILTFSLVLFAVPYAWENTLAGFQAQFYFVLLFSVLSIWLLLRNSAFSHQWWFGVLLSVVAYFSLASGVFALAAVVGTCVLRRVVNSPDRREIAGALVLLLLFTVGVLWTPSIAHHASLKASSVGQLMGAMAKALAWPSQPSRPSGAWLMALVRNAPWIVFAVIVLWRRTPRTRAHWFLIAMGLWVAGQAVGVSYGRAVDVLSSRYLDLHSMALLINFAALVAVGGLASDRWKALWGWACAAWLTLVLVALFNLMDSSIPIGLNGKRASSATQEANLRSYLSSGDREAMRKLPFFDLPYPSAERLANVLDSGIVRDILPKNLQSPLLPIAITGAQGAFQEGGAFPQTTDCGCRFIGSYSAQGDAGRGDVRLRYEPHSMMAGPRSIEIKVAGYPSKAGRIEIEQDGVVRKVRIGRDPGEQWTRIYVPVASRPFDLHLVDESPSSWLAVSDPVLSGRLDPILGKMLVGWTRFIAIGSVLACLLALLSVASKCAPAPTSRATTDAT